MILLKSMLKNITMVVSMFVVMELGKFHESLLFIIVKERYLMVMLPGMIFTIEPMINEGIRLYDFRRWMDCNYER